MQSRNNKVMKKLDYYIGIPLLYFLGIFHVKNKLPDLLDRGKPYHFVLLKTAAIGDTILLSAIAQELKSYYPESHITLVCSQNNAAMGKLLHEIDDIYVFKMNNPLISLFKIKRLHNIDVILDFAAWTRINGLIAWTLKSKCKIGFYCKAMHRHYVYDICVEHKDTLHEIDNYRNILRCLNLPLKKFIPYIIPQEKFNASNLVQGKYVVFHLFPGGASADLRSWANEKWIELGKRIFSKYGYAIILSGGNEDCKHAQQILSMLLKVGVSAVSVAGVISLDELNGVLRQAELLVTVNTGIMHLGAAVNIPLIALHGATDYKRWGPISAKAVVVQSNEPCQPCISLGFESKCRNPVCMQNITVDMVWEQVKKATKLH